MGPRAVVGYGSLLALAASLATSEARADEKDARAVTVIVRVTTSYGEPIDDARVWIDDRPAAPGAAMPLDPGEHRVHAERPGAPAVDAHVLVSPGEKDREIQVRFPAPPPWLPPLPTPESQHGLPLVTSIFTVVGGAGLVAFAFLGTDARSKVDDLRARCAPHCAPSEVDAARREALAADVCLGAGIAALGFAAYTFFTHRRDDAPAVDVRPTRGGAVGSFAIRF